MKKLTGLFLWIILLAGGEVAGDVLVAYWNFGLDAAGYTEDVTSENAVGTPSLTGMSAGTGYDSNGQGGISFIDMEGSTHNSGQALAWGSGVDEGDQEWILDIDLTGYQNLTIRWDYRSTGTGPVSADLDYKVGAGSWISIESPTFSTDSAYHEYQRDLSAILGINNQSLVQFRLSNFSGGSGSGTHRIDNLQLTAIPEPAVLGFISLTGLGFIMVRRLML